MKRGMSLQVKLIALALVAVTAYAGYQIWWHINYYVTERDDFVRPGEDEELVIEDDRLADKSPDWDETLVDSRPLGDFLLNASAAVIRLDCPPLRPGVDDDMLRLRPSYAMAIVSAREHGYELLPSANMIDAAAKQFDDGLYAAIDLAWFEGRLGPVPGAVDFIEKVFAKTPEGNSARAFLAAALELAGKSVPLAESDARRKEALLAEFRGDETASKPISFYTWTPELERVWRFDRFLQHQFTKAELDVPAALAAVLQADEELLDRYRTITAFYGRMTNPALCLPVDALSQRDKPLAELAAESGVHTATVAFFPPSTSRETELFADLFGRDGLPPDVNLMNALVRRIRSGAVDLEPNEEDGWYQHQVYALETLLLPSKGRENEKLLMTAAYKRRLVEAFKALVTKRRETHVRSFGGWKSAPDKPSPNAVRPRLRLEPCATFYLRTARAYAFLSSFLTALVGQERLAGMHGLREGGPREANLADELDAMAARFYGFYLIACEDIGMRPQLADDEPVDREEALRAALAWLDGMADDADVACDVRVAAPIYHDPATEKSRLWAVLGVRFARLDASYAHGPKIRPMDGEGRWSEVQEHKLAPSTYVIPVDEFAEIELDGLRALTRDEFREACNRTAEKEALLQALSAPRRALGP